MFILQITQSVADKFQVGLDQEGLDSSPGILVRLHGRKVGEIDYGITNLTSELPSIKIKGVLFYFAVGLPNEVWNGGHNGINYTSVKIP